MSSISVYTLRTFNADLNTNHVFGRSQYKFVVGVWLQIWIWTASSPLRVAQSCKEWKAYSNAFMTTAEVWIWSLDGVWLQLPIQAWYSLNRKWSLSTASVWKLEVRPLERLCVSGKAVEWAQNVRVHSFRMNWGQTHIVDAETHALCASWRFVTMYLSQPTSWRKAQEYKSASDVTWCYSTLSFCEPWWVLWWGCPTCGKMDERH